MLTLVRRARRRFFGNELLAQGANAASVALGALILLLLVGTQILNWQWAIPIPLIAGIAGFYRARRRLPSAYAVAQIVDHRMALDDSLSTALFFSQDEAASRVSAEVCKLQFDRADRLAGSVDIRKAIPYTFPRTVYLMAALILVASSLFALRYGLTRSLDLKPPLASILEQSFGGEQRTEQAKNHRPLPQPEPQTEPDDSGANAQNPDQKAGDQPDSDAANASEESGDSKVPGDSKAANSDAKKQGDEGEKPDGDQKDERSGEGESPNGQPGDSKSDPKEDASAKQDSSNNSGDSSSLMSKVKDAVQNLLSRMKPQPGQPGAQQQQSMDQKNSQGKQQNGNKQQGGKDGQQQNGGQQGDAQEGQSGEEAQNPQDPQGKGTGKSENQQPSKQPGSGIGSQDGDKSIKQAEQLAAMGKISEIFGKRSANITGEATVEVQNTSQQLRTQYAQRGVQHTQNGAQINRDEIPVVLQTYVEQYFEQVRKQKK